MVQLCSPLPLAQEPPPRATDFMMSYPLSEDETCHYETLTGNDDRTNHYETLIGKTPPPTYYSPNQTRSVSTVAPQWSIMPQNTDPSSPFFQTFLKGKPKPLGILVICAAILEIGLGIALFFTTFTITQLSFTPFWGPVFYIIAGSLTIASQRKPNVCLIQGSLSLNIISSIFSMVAVILNAIDLGNIPYLFGCRFIDHEGKDDEDLCQKQIKAGSAVFSLLLVINLLLFCVTLSTSIFGCRSLSKVQFVPQVFMLQNDVVLPMNPGDVPVTATYARPPPQPYPM